MSAVQGVNEFWGVILRIVTPQSNRNGICGSWLLRLRSAFKNMLSKAYDAIENT
jgi:hypothetical protein